VKYDACLGLYFDQDELGAAKFWNCVRSIQRRDWVYAQRCRSLVPETHERSRTPTDALTALFELRVEEFLRVHWSLIEAFQQTPSTEPARKKRLRARIIALLRASEFNEVADVAEGIRAVNSCAVLSRPHGPITARRATSRSA
jgi:hypothetical protein